MGEVKELVGFLSDVKPEVRLIAASHLLTVDLSRESPSLLAEMTESLCRRLAGEADFAKVALSILVNISEHDIVQTTMENRKSLSSVYQLVADPDSSDDVVELASMLLCNLTRSPRFVLQLLEVDSDFVGRRFLALCGKFLSSSEKQDPGARDPLAWLAIVIQNCSQVVDARRFLLDRNRKIMSHLSRALIKFKSVPRRRGVAATIRNCLMDTDHHSWLVEPPVNLIQSILVSLVNGKASYDDDEKRAMPVEVREAAFNVEHKAEPDSETRRYLVESLNLLCFHGIIAERIKLWSGYPIIRELERFEKDEEVMKEIYSAVDLLVRDHDDFLAAKRVQAGATLSEREKKQLEGGPKSAADLQREILALTEEEKQLAECFHCKKTGTEEEPLMRCTGCYSVSFCSKKCQIAKWKEHKPTCLELQKRNKQWEEESSKETL